MRACVNEFPAALAWLAGLQLPLGVSMTSLMTINYVAETVHTWPIEAPSATDGRADVGERKTVLVDRLGNVEYL